MLSSYLHILNWTNTAIHFDKNLLGQLHLLPGNFLFRAASIADPKAASVPVIKS